MQNSLPRSTPLGSFVHTNEFDTWSSQAKVALGTGSLHGVTPDYGIYGVVNQELFESGGRTIAMFLRGGGAPPNVNFIDWYIDGGLSFRGFIPGRSDDTAGIAVAHSSISRDFSNAQVLQGNQGFSSETVLEATYSFTVAPWWTIQPDFQYIWNPSAQNGSNDAAVIGIRTVVTF
jgi:porin